MPNLSNIMEFDHVIMVGLGGEVLDAPKGTYAPESLIGTDDNGQILPDDERAWRESITSQGWETFTDGYSGQYRYRGPIMHASEDIGGRLARDILERPGLYVAVVVTCLPLTEDAETEDAGWAVLRRDIPHLENPGHEPGRLYGCLACETACYCTGNPAEGNCIADTHDYPNQPEEAP